MRDMNNRESLKAGQQSGKGVMRSPGDWLTVGLIAAPVVIAAVLGFSFADTALALDYLGRLAGVAGLACLLVAAILSVRIPLFDRLYGGLSRLWRQHHYIGLAAFLLLLAHPLLMALSRAPYSLAAVQEVLLPPIRDWAMWAGWVGLLAMMVFLAPSFQFFGRPEYQRWKALHFLAGLALLMGLVHALPLTRTMPTPVMAAVWGLLGGAAVLIFIWRATLARPVMRRTWNVASTRHLADRVVEIDLVPEEGSIFDYQPGQFIYFTPYDPGLTAGRAEEHPFTLCSAPGDDRLRIAVKALGDASNALQSLATDTKASVEGPYGDFFPQALRHKRQLWIGGGIGITPFVSAARALEAGMAWGDVVMINCAQSPERAYYFDVLKVIAQDQSGLNVMAHYFAQEGPLSREYVLEHCPEAAELVWFVCGPPQLVELARKIADELGVSGRDFHSEAFDFL